ncbi:H-NS histone family protein [Burkholderia sp. 4701]|nr:H-NS histone family protein [Burkholderia sp. 4701]MXN87181.1 H-NS histone family protein [Burkholderia sp. 4812]
MDTYRELLNHLQSLKLEIEAAREREAHLIAERVLEVLAECGVPIDELVALCRHDARIRPRAKQKYWDPRTGATWSGRGRTPRWMVGKNPDEFLIDRRDDARHRKDGSQ